MHARIATGVLTGIAVFAAHAADAPTQPEASATQPRAVMTSDQVVQVLDETVDWYRTLGAQQQAARQPSDLLILYANRQTADQIMKLAFDFARANAELLSSEAGVKQAAEEAASEQSLSRLRKRLDDQRASIQAEIEASRRQLASTAETGSGDAAIQDLGAAGTAGSPERTTQHALEHGAVRERDRCDGVRRERAQGAHRCDCRLHSRRERHASARGTGVCGLRLELGRGGIACRRRQLDQPLRHLGSGGHGVSAFGEGAHDRADRSAHRRAASRRSTSFARRRSIS